MAGKPLAESKTVRVSLASAVHRYLTDREVADCSPATLRWYGQKLAQLQAEIKVEGLADLSRQDLLGLIAEIRRRGRSSAYLRGWYQIFRSFLGWCRAEGYEIHPSLVAVHGDQWFTIKKPVTTDPGFQVYSGEDIDRVLDAAATARNRIFIRLLLETGLRLNEALAVTVEDVEEDVVRVRSGKGRKPRRVPLGTKMQRDLHRYIERMRPDVDTDALFLNRSGTAWSEWGVRSLFVRLSKETGLRLHAHAFRHTYATNYLRKGGDIYRLQRILGHTTITMSLRYAHLTGADLSKDIDQLTDWR